LAEATVWDLYAYMHGDADGDRDERRTVPEWQVEDALRWCRFRGYDCIVLTRSKDTVEFGLNRLAAAH